MDEGGILRLVRELLRDPSTLSSLLSLLGGMVPNEGETGEGFDKISEISEPDVSNEIGKEPIEEPASVPTLSPISVPAKGGHRGRELLCAVRPYMSEDRCRTIDRILHTLTLVELLRSTTR